MKRLLWASLSLLLVFSFVGCSDTSSSSANAQSKSTVENRTPAVKINVPDTLNIPLSEALKKLDEAGFTNIASNAEKDPSWEENRWIVVEQNIPSGTAALPDEEIQLTCRKICHLYIDLKSEANPLFSTYDMDIFLDDKKIGTVANGQVFTDLSNVLEGDHAIRAVNAGNDSVSASKNLTISEDMTFSADIAHGSNIEFKNIKTSSGTQSAELIVDDVVGMVLNNAVSKLTESGFVNIYYQTVDGNSVWDQNNWTVVSQNIEAGSTEDKTVQIVLDVQKTDVLAEEANQVQSIKTAIDAIGEVTIERSIAIQEARKLYDGSKEHIKKQVDNYATLEEAETKLSLLLDEQAVNEAEEAINSIGEVTLDSSAQIETARNMYNRLEERNKNQISNYSVLEEAEAKLSQLLDEKAISEVEAAIDAIGEVTADSSDVIENARTLFDNLDDRIKNQVNNYATLKKAELVLSQIRAESVNTLLDNMDLEALVTQNPDDIKAAYEQYSSLTNEEKKNISKAEELESAMEIIAENESADRIRAVEDSIKALTENNSDNAEEIRKTLSAYYNLSESEKQQISNYEDLQDLNKKLKDTEAKKANESEPSILTKDNNDDLAAILTADYLDPDKQGVFARKYKGKTIEFDCLFLYVEKYPNYDTIFDFVLVPGTDENHLGASLFMVEQAQYISFKFSGNKYPDRLAPGVKIRLQAEVVSGPDPMYIYLKPIKSWGR